MVILAVSSESWCLYYNAGQNIWINQGPLYLWWIKPVLKRYLDIHRKKTKTLLVFCVTQIFKNSDKLSQYVSLFEFTTKVQFLSFNQFFSLLAIIVMSFLISIFFDIYTHFFVVYLFQREMFHSFTNAHLQWRLFFFLFIKKVNCYQLTLKWLLQQKCEEAFSGESNNLRQSLIINNENWQESLKHLFRYLCWN